MKWLLNPARQKPAVDDDGLAVGVARRGADQIEGRADEFFGTAKAILRRMLFEPFAAGDAFDEGAAVLQKGMWLASFGRASFEHRPCNRNATGINIRAPQAERLN
jgi:hypothetical protein